MQLWCLNVINPDRAGHAEQGSSTTWRAGLVLLVLLLSAGSASAQPSGLFNNSRPAFLDVDEAFQFYTSLDSEERVSIHWTVAPAYYLYRDKFSFSLITADDSTHELVASMPSGTRHHDEFFGDVEVYYNSLTTTLTLPAEGRHGPYQLQIQYQGCAEAGLCYPPQSRLLEISP